MRGNICVREEGVMAGATWPILVTNQILLIDHVDDNWCGNLKHCAKIHTVFYEWRLQLSSKMLIKLEH